jgi:hypothetical protein
MKIFVKISCPKYSTFCVLYQECNCCILVGSIGSCAGSTRSFPNSNFQTIGATGIGCLYHSSPYSITKSSSYSIMLFSSQNAARPATFNLCAARVFSSHISLFKVHSKSDGRGRGFPICGTLAILKKWSIASLGIGSSFFPFFPLRSDVMLPLTCFLPVPSHGASGFFASSKNCF